MSSSRPPGSGGWTAQKAWPQGTPAQLFRELLKGPSPVTALPVVIKSDSFGFSVLWPQRGEKQLSLLPSRGPVCTRDGAWSPPPPRLSYGVQGDVHRQLCSLR